MLSNESPDNRRHWVFRKVEPGEVLLINASRGRRAFFLCDMEFIEIYEQ